MADARGYRPGLGVFGYALLMLLIIFAKLLPLNTAPLDWPRPDYMAALTLAIALRRPSILPIWLVAALFLLADFLFQRPPGLWALCILAASETARHRAEALRASSFWSEWATGALLLAGAFLAARLIEAAMLLPLAPLLPYMLLACFTMLAYAPVALTLGFAMGLRRRAPGELDYRGRRI